ncbi:unnamed protein product [Trichobilharzia regenti]|nr:unnamed protein product [Trichobilharzia regenti]
MEYPYTKEITYIFIKACGIALIVIGSLAQVAINKYSAGMDANVKGLYAILLSVIVAAEIGAGIAAVVLKEDVKKHFTATVKSSVAVYSSNPELQKLIDKIQSESSNDYSATGQTVPESCKDPATKVAYADVSRKFLFEYLM